MTTTTVPLLDPESPAADDVLNTLARFQLAIDARKRAAQMRDEQPAVEVRQTRRKAA